MKKYYFIIIFLGVQVFAQESYEPGVILVKVRQPDIIRIVQNQIINGSSQLQAVFNNYRIINSRKLSHVDAHTDGWYRIEIPLDAPLDLIRSSFLNCPDISHVNLNYFGRRCGIPNDPLWSYQWALKKIRIPQAWDIIKPNSSILVGIIDGGIYYTHPDLSDNIWSNPNETPGDTIDNDNNGYIDDVHGWDFNGGSNNVFAEVDDYHGTGVSGIIAARTYNNAGLAGIAGGWQNQSGVKLIAERIFLGDVFGQQSAKEAIDYLTDLRQLGFTVIANMSFGNDVADDDDLLSFKESVESAKNAV